MTAQAIEKVKVGILGASGYGGAELLRRLLVHPHVTVSGVASRQFLGQRVGACWPQLIGCSDLSFRDTDAVIAGCDVLFCATPHAETAPLVKRALDVGKRVVDLSADFRLSPEDYAVWYGPHPHPELCERAVYGLVELHRDELKDAELIAVPGCNSTTANLALAPLAANGLLGRDIIVTVLAGVSGAGRSTSLGLHYAEVNENTKPYKVAGTHRHIAEIEATLGRVQVYGKRVKTHGDFCKTQSKFYAAPRPGDAGNFSDLHDATGNIGARPVRGCWGSITTFTAVKNSSPCRVICRKRKPFTGVTEPSFQYGLTRARG